MREGQERETDSQTETKTDSHTGRKTDRQTSRDKDRQTARHTDKEKGSGMETCEEERKGAERRVKQSGDQKNEELGI